MTRDSIIVRGPEFFVIRTGQRGALHVAVRPGSRDGQARFLTACAKRVKPADVTVWREREGVKAWELAERHCPTCRRKVDAVPARP